MTPAKPILMSAGLGIYKSMSDSTKISWCDSTAGPCDPAWQESIAEQGKAAGVAVFTKQVSIGGKVSHDPQEWPAALRVQEWPEGF